MSQPIDEIRAAMAEKRYGGQWRNTTMDAALDMHDVNRQFRALLIRLFRAKFGHKGKATLAAMLGLTPSTLSHQERMLRGFGFRTLLYHGETYQDVLAEMRVFLASCDERIKKAGGPHATIRKEDASKRQNEQTGTG